MVFTACPNARTRRACGSGFVAATPTPGQGFLRYRTYHGCAFRLQASATCIAAWRDEAHVRENRRLYRKKFDAVLGILDGVLDVGRPPDGRLLSVGALCPRRRTFARARQLFERQNVTVACPGRYLSRDADGVNPAQGNVRIALVAGMDECDVCVQAARPRIQRIHHLSSENEPETVPSDIQSIIVDAFRKARRDHPAQCQHQRTRRHDGGDRTALTAARSGWPKREGGWVVNDWVKKAVLLSFPQRQRVHQGRRPQLYDKVPHPSSPTTTHENSGASGCPHRAAGHRAQGPYIAPNCVLMPSYVNIGACVDPAPWSTPGPPSAFLRAQIGKNVHLPVASGSAACSSRCRPRRPSSRTTASSARAEVVEGVIVEEAR